MHSLFLLPFKIMFLRPTLNTISKYSDEYAVNKSRYGVNIRNSKGPLLRSQIYLLYLFTFNILGNNVAIVFKGVADFCVKQSIIAPSIEAVINNAIEDADSFE